MAEAEETPKQFCPNCNQRTMKKHCESDTANCTWAHCTDKTCDAMLDFHAYIGNAINSVGQRFRLHFSNGKWVERPNTVR